MRILGLTRGDREPFVPALDGERLRFVDGGDARQPHLLDQPILQGLVGALHSALGLRDRGVNELDAQTAVDESVESGGQIARTRSSRRRPAPL
jgi:hypothetical protein